MSAPDPEGMGLLGKVMAAAVLVVPPIWGARTWLEKRFEKKADKEEVDKTFVLLHGELTRQRDVQAKIFDKIEKNHTEILNHLLKRG